MRADGLRCVVYGEDDGRVFERVCPLCGRFVLTDDESTLCGDEPNATCSKHGRVRMPAMGWESDFEWREN